MSAGLCRPGSSPGFLLCADIFCVPCAQALQGPLRADVSVGGIANPVATQVGPDQRETLEMRLSATNPGYHPRDDKAIDAIVRADAGKSPAVPTRRSVPWPLVAVVSSRPV